MQHQQHQVNVYQASILNQTKLKAVHDRRIYFFLNHNSFEYMIHVDLIWCCVQKSTYTHLCSTLTNNNRIVLAGIRWIYICLALCVYRTMRKKFQVNELFSTLTAFLSELGFGLLLTCVLPIIPRVVFFSHTFVKLSLYWRSEDWQLTNDYLSLSLFHFGY